MLKLTVFVNMYGELDLFDLQNLQRDNINQTTDCEY